MRSRRCWSWPRRSTWPARRAPGLLEVPELANARGLREAGCLPDAGPGLTEPLDRAGMEATEEIRAGARVGRDRVADPLRGRPPARLPRHRGLALGPAGRQAPRRLLDLRERDDPSRRRRLPARDPRRERRHRHPSRGPPATGPAVRLSPRRHPPQLGRPCRAVPRARPRHRRLLPAHRLRRPRRRRPHLLRHHRRRNRRPRHPLAGPPRRLSAPEPDSRAAAAPARGHSARSVRQRGRAATRRALPREPGAPSARLFKLGTYRDLWVGSDHRAQSAAEVPGAAAASRDGDRGCRSARAEERRRGQGRAERYRASRARVDVKERVADGAVLPDRGDEGRQRQRAAQRRPGQRRASRRPASDPDRRHAVRRSDLDHGRQVDRDLRRDLRDRAGDDGGRAQADRPLPAPLRPQPGRPLRPPAAARRPLQTDQQAGLPPGQRDPGALRPRAAAAGPRRGDGAGDHPLGRRPGRRRPLRDRRPDRASSTSSRSARSASTGCCSAAGPRAPNTACSARCAAPRS